MTDAHDILDLRQQLGDDVLLLPWPLGKKAGKRRWKHLSGAAMDDPAYLRKLVGGNIGVALGRVSGGLCSLDIDSDDDMAAFLKENPVIGNTLHSRGSRGGHLWWRLDGDYPSLTPLKRHGEPYGEWRSNGAQTVIFGQHPNGNAYKIINRVKPVTIQMIQIKWPEGIFPLLQGVSLVSDTERTELTELPERIEPTECTERTEANRSGKVVAGVVSLIMNHDDAVRVSMPTGTHQNHDCLFKLARAIKALALHDGRDIPLTEMNKIFLKWHSRAMPFLDPSQNADDYWFEFLDAHEKADHPLGIDVIAAAWSTAQSKSPPPVAEQFATTEIRMLVSLCRELQALARDKPFFLSTRSVQRLFRLPSPMSASRWLNGLCRSQILKIVVRGSNETKRATRFLYLPPL